MVSLSSASLHYALFVPSTRAHTHTNMVLLVNYEEYFQNKEMTNNLVLRFQIQH